MTSYSITTISALTFFRNNFLLLRWNI